MRIYRYQYKWFADFFVFSYSSSRSSGDYAQSIGGVEALIFAVEVTLLFTNFHLPRKFREILILGRSFEKRRACECDCEDRTLLLSLSCPCTRTLAAIRVCCRERQDEQRVSNQSYAGRRAKNLLLLPISTDRCRPSSWCFRSNTRQIKS